MTDFNFPLALLEDVHSELSESVVPKPLVTFGNVTVQLLPCCLPMAEGVGRLFHHLRIQDVPHVRYAMVCMACRLRFPGKIRWDWAEAGQNPAAGIAWHMQGTESVLVADQNYSRGVIVSRRLRPEQFGRREVMRLALQPFLDVHDVVGIHGATIGDTSTGVFLSNKGGSGKSTLVAQAIKMGLRTTGDDFLLLPPHETNSAQVTVASFFSNLKIHETSPSSSGLRVGEKDTDAKGFVDIALHFPDALVQHHRISAVVIPSVGDSTKVFPATRSECLNAILPSSIYLTGSPKKLVDRVHQILDTTAAFRLTVGPNPLTGVEALEVLTRR